MLGTSPVIQRVITGPSCLVQPRLAGPHARLGRDAVRAAIRRLTSGSTTWFDAAEVDDITADEAWAAIATVYGWKPENARAQIDACSLEHAAFRVRDRLRALASAGGRIGFATSRPASLLPCFTALARGATDRGARVLTLDRFGLDGGRDQLWWHDGVAVVTDGTSLLATDGRRQGADWLFAIGAVDLVVADRGFAAAAVGEGIPTVVFADLDEPGFAVAALRGLPVDVLPVDTSRPPNAYGPLVDMLRP